MPLSELTLLSGSNASGKSSVFQALVLLHQTIRENEWGSRLILNGDILKLGKVQDVVNKIHGRHGFELVITDDESSYRWRFSGERPEMSMDVHCLSGSGEGDSPERMLNRLLPFEAGATPSICKTLEFLTYITAERIGPRDYYPLEDRITTQAVGPKGEHAISRLYRLEDNPVHEAMVIGSVAPTLMRQVEAWMREFFPGCGIAVSPISRMNAVTLGIRTSDETDYHRPINVGFGLTQVLPIIVAVLSAAPDDLIIIENPEVHLHPAGQALMGRFLAIAASTGPQIVVETHSDHILNGIRRAVRNKTLAPSQVCLHFFRAPKLGFDQVVSPQLESSGNLDVWPEGFFDQFDKDMNHFAGWSE
nr:DUF3696 domain-containing protein [Marinobacter sp. S6332]